MGVEKFKTDPSKRMIAILWWKKGQDRIQPQKNTRKTLKLATYAKHTFLNFNLSNQTTKKKKGRRHQGKQTTVNYGPKNARLNMRKVQMQHRCTEQKVALDYLWKYEYIRSCICNCDDEPVKENHISFKQANENKNIALWEVG